MSKISLREEIDRYVIDNAERIRSIDDHVSDYTDFKVVRNTHIEVTVLWDRCDGRGLTTDEEYSFNGKYPDWLIHVNTMFYPHVAESEDWEKIEDGVYEVIYTHWC